AHPYTWPHDAGASGGATALLIIDMQADFLSPAGYLSHQLPPTDTTTLPRLRGTIAPILRLRSHFHALRWPVIYTREGHPPSLETVTPRELFRSRNNPSGLGIGDAGPLGRLLVRGERGHAIVDELTPAEGEAVVDKPGRGAFTRTDLQEVLEARGVRRLVVVGVTTDCCVSSTVREADDRGYEVLVVREAVAAVVERLGEAALEMVAGEGGIFGAVAGVEEV
ncbi:Isochorismatase-like protein, partial [Geopyxis carbonaria]